METERHSALQQTMPNWLLKCTEDYLVPIYDRLRAQLLQHKVLHAMRPHFKSCTKKAKSHRAKVICGCIGQAEIQIIRSCYMNTILTEKRNGQRIFSKVFTVICIQTAIRDYHSLPREISVFGCWAYARVKFDVALKGLPKKHERGSLSWRAK